MIDLFSFTYYILLYIYDKLQALPFSYIRFVEKKLTDLVTVFVIIDSRFSFQIKSIYRLSGKDQFSINFLSIVEVYNKIENVYFIQTNKKKEEKNALQ